MLPTNIIKDKTLLTVFGLSFVILIFTLILALIMFGDITGPLVIHFDVYKGIDFFGGRTEVFGILWSGFAMLVINALLANFLYDRERFLSFLFAFVSLAFSILILIAAGVIISVN